MVAISSDQSKLTILSVSGRTRTREKYRMVYTDGQRLELEKEFITSEYISTQRKAYLSRALGKYSSLRFLLMSQ